MILIELLLNMKFFRVNTCKKLYCSIISFILDHIKLFANLENYNKSLHLIIFVNQFSFFIFILLVDIDYERIFVNQGQL